MVYAGFWRRFFAYFLDRIIIACGLLILLVPIGLIAGAALAGHDLIEAAQKRHEMHTAPLPPHAQLQEFVPLAQTAIVKTPAPVAHSQAVPPKPADAENDSDAEPEFTMPANTMPEKKDDDLDKISTFIAVCYSIIVVFYFIASALYNTLFISSKWQATPGKRVMGCIVVTTDGQKLDRGHAFGRHVACILSWLPFIPPFYIGYFLAGWTKQSTALHDLIASTRVVRTVEAIPPVIQAA